MAEETPGLKQSDTLTRPDIRFTLTSESKTQIPQSLTITKADFPSDYLLNLPIRDQNNTVETADRLVKDLKTGRKSTFRVEMPSTLLDRDELTKISMNPTYREKYFRTKLWSKEFIALHTLAQTLKSPKQEHEETGYNPWEFDKITVEDTGYVDHLGRNLVIIQGSTKLQGGKLASPYLEVSFLTPEEIRDAKLGRKPEERGKGVFNQTKIPDRSASIQKDLEKKEPAIVALDKNGNPINIQAELLSTNPRPEGTEKVMVEVPLQIDSNKSKLRSGQFIITGSSGYTVVKTEGEGANQKVYLEPVSIRDIREAGGVFKVYNLKPEEGSNDVPFILSKNATDLLKGTNLEVKPTENQQ